MLHSHIMLIIVFVLYIFKVFVNVYIRVDYDAIATLSSISCTPHCDIISTYIYILNVAVFTCEIGLLVAESASLPSNITISGDSMKWFISSAHCTACFVCSDCDRYTSREASRSLVDPMKSMLRGLQTH